MIFLLYAFVYAMNNWYFKPHFFVSVFSHCLESKKENPAAPRSVWKKKTPK